MILNGFRNVLAPANMRAGIPILVFWTAIAFIVDLQTRVPAHYILRDPLATASYLFTKSKTDPTIGCCAAWLGWVSNLGSALWFVAAGTCVLYLLATVDRHETRVSRTFFALALVLSTALGLDDLFMLHESVLVRLGVPEAATYGAYVVLFAIYALAGWSFRNHLRAPFLAFALAALAASAYIDVVVQRKQFWEDILKLAGIVYWTSFHALLATDLLRTPRRSES